MRLSLQRLRALFCPFPCAAIGLLLIASPAAALTLAVSFLSFVHRNRREGFQVFRPIVFVQALTQPHLSLAHGPIPINPFAKHGVRKRVQLILRKNGAKPRYYAFNLGKHRV